MNTRFSLCFLTAAAAAAVTCGCGATNGTKQTNRTLQPAHSTASPSPDPVPSVSLPSMDPSVLQSLQAADDSALESDQPFPGESSPDDSTTAHGVVGDTVDVSDDEGMTGHVQLVSVKRYSSVHDPYEGTIRPENGAFLVLTILYRVESGSLDYNELDFSAQSPDGTAYEEGDGKSFEAETAMNLSGSLSSGTLHEGQKRRGVMVIDGPRHGEILYAPFEDVLATWKY
jgi:hypothetical protein